MDIAVIGGGIIGVSCAVSLARSGAKVSLFTEKELGSGASGRSLSWLNASGDWPAEYYHLRVAGIDRFRTLYCQNPGIDWLKFEGAVKLANDEVIARLNSTQKERGYDSRLFQSAEVSAIDSKIDPAAVSEHGIFNAGEGWVSLPELMAMLVSEFLSLGGVVVENAGKSLPVLTTDGSVRGVVTSTRGEHRCDKVLLACGASTPKLLGELGIDMPDGSILSMVVTTEIADDQPTVVMNTPRVAMRPNPEKSLTLDHSWYEHDIKEDENGTCSVNGDVIAQLLSEADKVINSTTPLVCSGYKAGWKPVPADGYPVLGELASIPGCYVAFTHSGATLSLIVGELLSWEMVTGQCHPMLTTFRPERFEES